MRGARLEGVSRERGEREGVRGCTGLRGGREGAQHESAHTAEGTQKTRGKRAARAGTHQRGSGARGGDVQTCAASPIWTFADSLADQLEDFLLFYTTTNADS